MYSGMRIKIFDDTDKKAYMRLIDKAGYNSNVYSDHIVVGSKKRNEYDTVEMGRQLKLARCQMRLTRKDISKRIWTCPNTIGIWERGERMPSEDHLRRFCRVVGLNVDALMESVKIS